MAKNTVDAKVPVDQETIDACFAFAVAEGDIVNFRFLFLPYSPLRDDSPEGIDTDKYAYLLPEDESDPHFRAALALTQQPKVRDHIHAQFAKKGPAQLPSDLLLPLADNAVRLGKYTAAAQAYELLRIRRRMQELFFDEAERALDDGDVTRGVLGYRIATGLAYDYAAFPEPLPLVPNYQTRALMLHAEYPRTAEDGVAMLPPEQHIRTGLGYLLCDPEAAARLDARPMEMRVAFFEELVRLQDPAWDAFVERYHQACALTEKLAERFRRDSEDADSTLKREIAAFQEELDPVQVSECLLGRRIGTGEWWQYLKQLAYEHPAAVLFITRQAVSKDVEILMPRYRADSPLIARVGLDAATNA
jgi:hypothetical protein